MIFRRAIRRTFGKGGHGNHLQRYTIKNMMEYVSLSVRITPIGSMQLKVLKTLQQEGVVNTANTGFEYNKKVL
jgi:hypothetical protein